MPPCRNCPGVVWACLSTIHKISGMAGPDSAESRGGKARATPGTLTMMASRAARGFVAAPSWAGVLIVAWAWPGWYVSLTQAVAHQHRPRAVAVAAGMGLVLGPQATSQ